MNNCCKDEEIIKMINQNKKCCRPCFGPTGATGPTGPAGPATISVGVTNTGNPGTSASVTNVGTNQNAIFDFTVPAGPTGPQGIQGIAGPTGDVGPTGPQGPQGITGPQGPQGLVGPVGPAGSQGEQGIQGIQGPTGPTGPAGPAGPIGPQGVAGPQGIQGPTGPALSTFGRKYNITETPLSLEANIGQNVALGTTGPVNNVTTNTQNTLTVVENGVYLIEYYFSGSSSVNTTLTIGAKQNASSIGSTTITKEINANTNTDFVGSTINSLSAGDEIGISILSNNQATVTPSSGTNAYLNIVRIS